MTFLLQLANQQLIENNVWQQHISVLLLWSFPDYLSAYPLSIASFEKFWEIVNIKWVLENILWNTCENFGEMLEILRTFLRYFEIILWNCLEYFHEIWKLQKKCRTSKFWINFGKIVEEHPGNFKLLTLGNLGRILKMFLSSFSEIVKNFEEKWGIRCANF